METLKVGNWTTTDAEHSLSPRELEATMYALADLSVKQIAREMHIEAGTVQRRLDKARWKLGFQRTMRGLCMEVIRRGIVAPLSVLLCVAMVGGATTEIRTTAPNQRPAISRTVRSARNEVSYAAMPA